MPDLASVVEWSRWQFALTAMYHWLFVPLTLGLGFIIAVMETRYVRTRSESMLRTLKFWTALFAINFACGVATGIILEFQFGTNWSNYSWFVGDIFGAPLAIEGLLAFFLEATFFVVMIFGWQRVSPRFHLTATWLTAIGATISALWILVANAWMQYPVGMTFNPESMRNEMTDFWSVALSPVAINKLLHAVAEAWALGGAFVVAISAWKIRHGGTASSGQAESISSSEVASSGQAESISSSEVASSGQAGWLRSIKVASWIGLAGTIITIGSGHSSAVDVAKTQPMKLAAMEGLWHGGNRVELVAAGVLNPAKEFDNDAKPYLFKVGVPGMLSWMAFGNADAYVPGIYDIAATYPERMARGADARQALAEYGVTRNAEALNDFKSNYQDFGYGYYTDVKDLVPPVAVTFYAFHIMVAVGGWLLLFFTATLLIAYRRPQWYRRSWPMWVSALTVALAWVGSQAGWVCAEVGRQPWVIQNLMPTRAAISAVSASSVALTFWLFAAVFTLLLAAEISVMICKIRQ